MVKKGVWTIVIYMEGGGDTNDLHTELRKGMRLFLQKAGFQGMMPKVFACGTRNDAYRDFKNASCSGHAFLLVDSEEAVAKKHQDKPWQHLKERDGWEKPEGTENDQCHLMVQCMESWFLTDEDAVANYFGQGFKRCFPQQGQNIEAIAKTRVGQYLKDATKDCKTKRPYDKGDHSFKILGLIDPNKVKQAGFWTKRFFGTLEKHCTHSTNDVSQ